MQITAKDENSICLVQITDSHLYADKQRQLLGIPTWDSFQAVVQLALATQANPDLVLCTGDIAQDYSVQAYEYFQQSMQAFDAPCAAIGGNHDEMKLLDATGLSQNKVIEIGNWVLLLVHTPEYKQSHGYLEDDEYQWLAHQLETFSDRNVLVTCHHHAQPLDSEWLDGVGLKNGDKLMGLIEQHPQVKVLLVGHVHQEVDYTHKHTRVLATPSTCIQFKPKCKDFTLDERQPGFRWLTLHQDGSINTQVHRIDSPVFTPDMDAEGY